MKSIWRDEVEDEDVEQQRELLDEQFSRVKMKMKTREEEREKKGEREKRFRQLLKESPTIHITMYKRCGSSNKIHENCAKKQINSSIYLKERKRKQIHKL